jgi:hypothetical protein
VQIKEIRALGLHGATPEGGWSAELQAEDCVHTLIEVITDDGGAFTARRRCSSAL